MQRLMNRCKQFRRIATQYEKRAANYQALWLIALILSGWALQLRPRWFAGEAVQVAIDDVGFARVPTSAFRLTLAHRASA
jgi:hypothetical protein